MQILSCGNHFYAVMSPYIDLEPYELFLLAYFFDSMSKQLLNFVILVYFLLLNADYLFNLDQ